MKKTTMFKNMLLSGDLEFICEAHNGLSAKIVEEALRLNVPMASTWSCYAGGEHPCGVCDSCRIRDAALREAGRPDLASR